MRVGRREEEGACVHVNMHVDVGLCEGKRNNFCLLLFWRHTEK